MRLLAIAGLGTMRRSAGRTRGDEGRSALLVILVVVAVLGLGGLALDGSRYLAAHQDALDWAEEAARAGAQATDGQGRFALDAAGQSAHDFLARRCGGCTAEVAVLPAFTSVPASVQVTVHAPYRPVMFPWGGRRLEGTAVAHPGARAKRG